MPSCGCVLGVRAGCRAGSKQKVAEKTNLTQPGSGLHAQAYRPGHPQSILEDMIFLVFYGDLYHLFFDTILEEANSAYHVGRHPLENNFHNIRKRPVEWVDTVIQTGTVADWQRMSKEANRLRTPTSEWTQQTFASLANSLPL
eukprot:scaffold8334_cov164-Ochromonas_danica.AAC.3